jgi:hypothetical protein
MKPAPLLAAATLLLLADPAHSAAVILNEYNAVSGSSFLNGGTADADEDGELASDSYFGRVIGNGGDWLELVVTEDHLDLRGASVSIEEGSPGDRETTVLTFTQSSLWSDLRAGSIITIAEDLVDDPTYDPTGGDWWINVQASDGASGAFITASNFSVSNDDTHVTILDALAQILFGPAGEGIPPNAGLNAREVFKLETDPSDAITPLSPSYRDGSSSSFGAPNRWSGGENVQDFSALRSVVVPEPGALALVGLALLAIARARRAA